ncbi:MAG TPA: cryptochrome/photolyase family protein [Rhodocyclaceae bacterium]|nr:cryptochrome/photolyase family protein [Rhodocyclaceae bacterium]
MSTTPTNALRLIVILGDQLWMDNPALLAADVTRDVVVMVECTGEAALVPSHKARIALFFSAMRHFAQTLKRTGWNLQYFRIGQHAHAQIADALTEVVRALKPVSIMVCEPGEWRLEQALHEVAHATETSLKIFPDTSFYLTRSDFANWAKQQTSLRMERFYRFIRAHTGVLISEGLPLGGQWSYAHERPSGEIPGRVPQPTLLSYDETTWHTLIDVRRHFADHPGELEEFPWAVTREQALTVLEDFVANRLPSFDKYRDVMRANEPFLYHSQLASALNLRLLDPREVVRAVERALENGDIPLATAENFVRQIVGWREFTRGVYWLEMPSLASANHFKHTLQLPRWFWTGDTEMRCMKQAVTQTIQHGYAYHIQRLMVIGNFALMANIEPQQVSDWFLAMYVDAVEWAQLPNVMGMALYTNGGRFTSKPYVAPGTQIKSMSNYCEGCRYKPSIKSGPDACPFTTFFWHFLDNNQALLNANTRTAEMVKNLDRLSKEERAAIRHDAIRKLGRLDKL